jgi:hypothetical protein
MPKRSRGDSKIAVEKHTMNPPAKNQEEQPPQRGTADREVGQFTGRGVPSQQKK